MTVELITGFADTPHIDAADDGALNAAIISDSNHVLGTPSPAVMRDSNHLTVPTMEALFMGRHVRVTSAEDVTIASGSQGLKRHDIVGIRYSRNSSTSVETAVLDVIRGTASSTPADPALPTGNILTGASSAFMPLYRVPLDGITVGTPVPLFNVLRPMSELWDSAKQLPGIKTQISNLQNSVNQSEYGALRGNATDVNGLIVIPLKKNLTPRFVSVQPGPYSLGVVEAKYFRMTLWKINQGSIELRCIDERNDGWVSGKAQAYCVWYVQY